MQTLPQTQVPTFMSADSRLKTAIILAVIAVTAGCMGWQGLSMPVEDLCSPITIALALSGGIWFYKRQQEPEFVLCLTALLQMTFFTACYSVLMYSLGAIGRPFIDHILVAADRNLGLHVPDIAHFARQSPRFQSLLQLTYNSLLWQTPLVIVLLGFTGDRKRLEGFVRQFMFGTLFCAGVFALFPAEGPFVAYGYAPSASQTRYLTHLHELRDGTRTVISWSGAEGLITVPSFHTIWGLLLIWAVRGHRGWLTLSIVVNGLMIFSTMTTGWHYATDVATGCTVAGGVIALSAAWDRRYSLSETTMIAPQTSAPISSPMSSTPETSRPAPNTPAAAFDSAVSIPS